LPEDVAGEIDETGKKAEKANNDIQQCFGQMRDKVKLVSIDCSCSNEKIIEDVKTHFAPKIVLVNVEHHLNVPDNSWHLNNVEIELSNLAIKYNMLYICAHE